MPIVTIIWFAGIALACGGGSYILGEMHHPNWVLVWFFVFLGISGVVGRWRARVDFGFREKAKRD